MKNLKLCVLPFTVALLLTACGGKSNSNFKMYDPEDTSMLSANCKAYIDDMRAQQESLDDPYKYSDLNGEQGVHIEDTKYLDTGDVNGKNQTVSGQIPDRSDKSMGVELKFEPKVEAEEYTVLVSTDRNFENAKEFTTKGNSVKATNLFVNTKYYWKVVADDVESQVREFTTEDYPRWILARALDGTEDNRGIYNVRDMGGYMTESGKRVKQGLVFRGGEITTMTSSGHYNTITEASRKAFVDDMGMVGGVEIDLRGNSDIGDNYRANAFSKEGAEIRYQQIAIKSYEETFTRDGSGNNNPTVARENVRAIFELLKNADNSPVYYHCFGGADRTGTIGFLLNGVLGVSYTDLVIDFELTSYSSINNEHIRCHIPDSATTKHQHQYDRWPALINYVKTDTTGGYAWDDNALLKTNIENFLVKSIGVPQGTIDTIRDIMLED